MNTPLFEKITFKKVDTYSIKELCLQEDIGTYPVAVDPEELPLEIFLDNFESVLRELNIHPLFPHPIYIITQKIKHHHFFPVLGTIDDIPTFFKQKISSQRQNLLAQKNHILTSKINHSDIFSKHNELQRYCLTHKIIYHNAKEISFYKTILDSYRELK